ncbi:MAG: hypothetical protein WCR52_11265 [Bacteroidota bacterium]
MKTTSVQLYICAAIALAVLVGANSAQIPKVFDLFAPKTSVAPPPSAFESAHAAMPIPIPDEADMECKNGKEHNIPVPSELYLQDYERVLYTFILKRQYVDLNWCVDKRVRDTGPYIEDSYYGVHPAVRIYYSPSMMYWLTGDPGYWQEGKQSGKATPKAPRSGPVPDGAMIVKEMFTPPGTIYSELKDLLQKNEAAACKDEAVYEKLLGRLITSYTVMVKSSAGSHDGWFWAGPSAPTLVDGKLQTVEEAVESQLDTDTKMPGSGFGATCIRCHASAADDLTFSSLRNVAGFETEENIISYRVDNSWRSEAYFSNYPLSLINSDSCLRNAKAVFELPAPLRPYKLSADTTKSETLQFHRTPPAPVANARDTRRLQGINPAFTAIFPPLPNTATAKAFPSQFSDHVVAGQKIEQFITSDNCTGCHGGLGGSPYDVAMFVQTGPAYGDGYNVSEYGEWRWSPMGLAGRDPIFYAQLESEMVLMGLDAKKGGLLKGSLKDNQEQLTTTCLSCHGSMGQRQLKIDAKTDKTLDPNFKVDYVYLTELLSAKTPKPDNYKYHKYGELAREGISCMTCHHMLAPDSAAVAAWSPTQPNWINNSTPRELAYFLFHNTTGQPNTGPPGEVYGPFKDVNTSPMNKAIGVIPKQNAFIKQAQLCGVCHTINLPNIGMTKDEFPVLTAAEQNPALKPYAHTIEQETFLEWQNSRFSNSNAKGQPAQGFKSCQDCHMPGGFESPDGNIKIQQLSTKIATIQDQDYPEVDHRAPDADVRAPLRPDYKRHEHVGLNVFLLEMFNQFPDVLGVAKQDYMTSAKNGNEFAIGNMVRQAQNATVDIDVQVASMQGNQMTVNVGVQNKTGHRFPSGVAFRRAFLELLVTDAQGNLVWSSGRTNAVGVLLDGDGKPLKTEFLPNKNTYQPHYQTITQQDQVQIYEELTQDADYDFTTSFVHRVHDIKDNRLLPTGWRFSEYFENQGEVMLQFMKATDPFGTGNDPDYKDQGPAFPGKDNLQYQITLPAGYTAPLRVQVTMYYQSIPPYYLQQRFTTAPNGAATQRLYYLTSRLNVDDTPIENWKLPLVSMETKYDAKSGAWSKATRVKQKKALR